MADSIAYCIILCWVQRLHPPLHPGGGSGEEEEQDWPCQAKDAVQQTVCQHGGHIWQEERAQQ